MWIVLLALKRPYTFVVGALLIAIIGVLAILSMPTDIFPNIDIPVISVIFNYSGMSPDDMEKRIVTGYERILTTTVNDIEHIESQSLYGVGLVKIFFQKGAKIEAATAQVTAVSQTAIRQMPPGTQPPLVIRYSASSVPIIQLSLGSPTLPEQQLFDLGVNFLRPQLITVPGVQIPYPYGGKQRQIMVDLDPEKLYSWGISASDVVTAVNNQSPILPAGTAKIGTQEYQVKLNSSPDIATDINEMPIKVVNGIPVYIKDVSNVRDGFAVQTNVVHSDGKRGVLVSILKDGNSSTLTVVDGIKNALPRIQQTLPPDLNISPLFDQSLFVRASVDGVIREAIIAAGLTGLMILLFLGSWRSTLIVVVSIPLSILVSIIILYALGETLNTMTLGGLALAVGILVDDATVEIENIHRNLHQRKRLVRAILDGAQQIAVPAFVSTTCICIVFLPVAFVSGAAKYLFTPLAMSVVFAMMTSYLLSRTIVPTMVHYLLAAEVERYGGVLDPNDPHAHQHIEPPKALWRHFVGWMGSKIGKIFVVAVCLIVATTLAVYAKTTYEILKSAALWIAAHYLFCISVIAIVWLAWILIPVFIRNNYFGRVHDSFNNAFERLRLRYGALLAWALENAKLVICCFVGLTIVSALLLPFVGTDFFPQIDAGELRLHVRAPPGTRVEETENYFGRVEEVIRQDIPPEQIQVVLDNIGIPNSGINLSLSDGTLVSPADGEILVSLKDGHSSTWDFIRKIRKDLATKFPDGVFFFSPADIATQVLNFGLSAPIDIQISGGIANVPKNYEVAQKIADEVRKIPGAVDVHFQQVPSTPNLSVNVDRTLAGEVGLNQSSVANNLLISLSSTNQIAPNFWLNPNSGVSYNILVQTPQYKMDSVSDLLNTPMVPTTAGSDTIPQLLGNVASLSRGVSATNITHYDIRPTFDVLLGVQGRDLGGVSRGVYDVVGKFTPQLPRGSFITVRGQVQSMHDSFTGLSFGIVFAILLVYLLLVINFQSWLDPLIILMALPGALSGIIWMLYTTGTTINVPSLMGAVMSIGVATANSILMITFANEQRLAGRDAHDAALAAGLTRLRPVIMTALAMIIGMLPMSLGLGDGGEQNAPLGRAVIGGLLMATFATLFFVPIMYSKLRKKDLQTQVEEELR